MSALRGDTHATGILINPVPNWIVAGYGVRCTVGASCADAADARSSKAARARGIKPTADRIVRMNPPLTRCSTVIIVALRQRRVFLFDDAATAGNLRSEERRVG